MSSATSNYPLDFVVSYNQQAARGAMQLLDALEAFGLKGWIDQRYYYVPIAKVEGQIGRALARSLFTCIYAPNDFRLSPWCSAEFEFSRSTKEALQVQPLIIFTEDDETVLPELAEAPRFSLRRDGDLAKAARLMIENRTRVAQYLDQNPAKAAARGQRYLGDFLTRAERVALAARHFGLICDAFETGGTPRHTPQYAVDLELAGPSPAPQLPVHLSPELAIEMFGRALAEIFESFGYDWLHIDPNRVKTEGVTQDDWDCLTSALAVVTSKYKTYLLVAAKRRSTAPKFDELIALTDSILPPLRWLKMAGIDGKRVQISLWTTLRYFLQSGDGRTQTLAAFLLANLRRCADLDFRSELKEAMGQIYVSLDREIEPRHYRKNLTRLELN